MSKVTLWFKLSDPEEDGRMSLPDDAVLTGPVEDMLKLGWLSYCRISTGMVIHLSLKDCESIHIAAET